MIRIVLHGIVLAASAAVPLASAAPRACDPTAAQLAVTVTPDPRGPTAPRMGDRLAFRWMVVNHGASAATGMIVWLTLLRVDTGHEQAVDLEDWSTDKAVLVDNLASNNIIRRTWTLRLISSGTYRVLVGVATPDVPVPTVAASEAFTVAPKLVVESIRVLPVALGIPFTLGILLAFRLVRGHAGTGTEDAD
ncbi:hypothetical protein [Dankookia rubra]|uniref:hypothetical protein n=1 Tax=Dankookia rubra TaxID=1442381 RepID=UPI001409DEF6|nr:hypothetical protein [Dankookia rubra]